MPHVYCLRDPAVIALHAISDGIIAVSYFLIPVALILLVRRRTDLVFRWAFVLFGVFILACGSTHVLAIVTLWVPVYRLDGLVKAITAVASLGTAVLLIRLIPQAVALPSIENYLKEIDDRRHSEAAVKNANVMLENRVVERTKELETANLQLSELAAALDKAQTVIQDLDGKILFWNGGMESLYGWSREQALGCKSQELLSSELPIPFSKIMEEVIERGTWTGEFRQKRSDGAPLWVTSHWVLHRDAAGVPHSVVKVSNDITALKKTEEALRESEATIQALLENASQGILRADHNGWIVDANATAQGLFGFDRAELIGKCLNVLLPGGFQNRGSGESIFGCAPEDRSGRLLALQASANGGPADHMAVCKNGSGFPVETSLSFVAELQASPFMVFVSDVTPRKQAEKERERLIARLETALAEKTVLLKEVHHRVKNNLAVIAGLLGMQASRMEHSRARIALEESQKRVLSMALIHERLYGTDRLDRVNFGHYVRELTNELCAAYAVAPGIITVEVEAMEIDLSVHRAIPCGLILNELVSNALKYGFPGGRSGTLTVRFMRLESGDLSLLCRDDGVGIPESFDFEGSKSLGLRIVKILTKQIDGELILDRSGNGSTFEVRFPQQGHRGTTD